MKDKHTKIWCISIPHKKQSKEEIKKQLHFMISKYMKYLEVNLTEERIAQNGMIGIF